jgi:hypothetical protein
MGWKRIANERLDGISEGAKGVLRTATICTPLISEMKAWIHVSCHSARSSVAKRMQVGRLSILAEHFRNMPSLHHEGYCKSFRWNWELNTEL